MFDPFSMALIGGAVGGLLDKKDPLRGAALGAMGGYASPGLLGAAAETPAAVAAVTPGVTAGGQQASMLAAQNAGLGVEGLMATGAAGGNTAMQMAPSVMGMMKPVGQAAQTAAAVKSLFPQDQQMPMVQTPPPVVGQGGPQTLASLVSNNANKAQQIAAESQMRRNRRVGLLGA